MQTANQKHLLETHPTAGSSLLVREDLLGRVREILTDNGIGHWAQHFAVSVLGGPYETRIWLRHGADPAKAQAALDANL